MDTNDVIAKEEPNKPNKQESSDEEKEEETRPSATGSLSGSPDKKDGATPKKATRRAKKWKKPKDKPKRPLSAYNLFFQHEREKMLYGESKNLGDLDDSNSRPHRKTHGKIGFAELAKTIAGKWKTLDEDGRSVYESQAEEEQHRYKREIEVWKRNQRNASKRKLHKEQEGQGLPKDFVVSSATAPTAPASGFQDAVTTTSASSRVPPGAAAAAADPSDANVSMTAGPAAATRGRLTDFCLGDATVAGGAGSSADLLALLEQQQKQQMLLAQAMNVATVGNAAATGTRGTAGVGQQTFAPTAGNPGDMMNLVGAANTPLAAALNLKNHQDSLLAQLLSLQHSSSAYQHLPAASSAFHQSVVPGAPGLMQPTQGGDVFQQGDVAASLWPLTRSVPGSVMSSEDIAAAAAASSRLAGSAAAGDIFGARNEDLVFAQAAGGGRGDDALTGQDQQEESQGAGSSSSATGAVPTSASLMLGLMSSSATTQLQQRQQAQQRRLSSSVCAPFATASTPSAGSTLQLPASFLTEDPNSASTLGGGSSVGALASGVTRTMKPGRQGMDDFDWLSVQQSQPGAGNKSPSNNDV